MNELQLKYGCNPNQKPARVFMDDGTDLPITVLNGSPRKTNTTAMVDAFAEGAKEEKLRMAKKLKDMGLPTSQIAQATGLSVEEIEGL